MKTLTKEESKQIMLDHLNKEPFLRSEYFSSDNRCCIIGRLLKEVGIDNDDDLCKIYEKRNNKIAYKSRILLGVPKINVFFSDKESIDLFGISIIELRHIQESYDEDHISKEYIIDYINCI